MPQFETGQTLVQLVVQAGSEVSAGPAFAPSRYSVPCPQGVALLRNGSCPGDFGSTFTSGKTGTR